MSWKAVLKGIVASVALLSFYWLVVGLLSGWPTAVQQWARYWYFLSALAIGFGVQIALYSHLKELHCAHLSKGVVITSSTTGTLAMISCCAHYLVVVLPALGAVGLAPWVSKYQVQLFEIGLLFNFGGIAYLAGKVRNLTKTYEVA